MLKSVISAGNVSFRSAYNVSQNPICVQCVRWRKPRWIPVAQSKEFRVPERKKQDPEERAELMKLHNNYHTQIRSVRSYLIEEYKRNSETSNADQMIVTPEEQEADFKRCMDENDRWNAAIKEIRNSRLEKERADRREYILKRLEAKEEREEEAIMRSAAIVKREEELSKTFITRDKLDETIEYALANPVDYNFAIDLKGDMVKGRTTDIPQLKEDEKKRQIKIN